MTGCSLQRAIRPRGRAVTALAGLVLLVFAAGCGGAKSYLPRSQFIAFTPEQKVELESQVTHAYRIQEGDILKVAFAYEKNLNQEGVVVLNDGSINLVGVDRLRIVGLSLAEADSLITLAYSKEYREPALSIIMQETPGRRVYVLGKVANPGFYRVPTGGMDVMSAIAMANGFTEDASREGTLVVRLTPNGYQVQEVNLEAFGTADFAQTATVSLQSYDIVYVPRSRVGDFSYFARNVLSGLANFTRIAYDVRYITSGEVGGF